MYANIALNIVTPVGSIRHLPEYSLMQTQHKKHIGLRHLRRIAGAGWHAAFGTSPGDYARQIALRVYKKKYQQVEPYQRWAEMVGEARIAGHYAHSTLTDPFAIEHARSQLYELISTLRNRMDILGRGRTVLDAGASDGFFLEQLGFEKGVGLNILGACVRKIRSEGKQACCGDLESLPFQDKMFDTVICCETLEHLPNPIRALQELKRICRTRLFLTIPWTTTTRIKARPKADMDSHVFEFSASDFRKIISYTGLTIDFAREITVLPRIRNPIQHLIVKQHLWRSYFPKLQYYELIPSR